MEHSGCSPEQQLSNYEELVTEDGVDFFPSILAICSVKEANGGQYICTVGNTLGNVSVNFELSITVTGGRQILTAFHFCVR